MLFRVGVTAYRRVRERANAFRLRPEFTPTLHSVRVGVVLL